LGQGARRGEDRPGDNRQSHLNTPRHGSDHPSEEAECPGEGSRQVPRRPDDGLGQSSEGPGADKDHRSHQPVHHSGEGGDGPERSLDEARLPSHRVQDGAGGPGHPGRGLANHLEHHPKRSQDLGGEATAAGAKPSQPKHGIRHNAPGPTRDPATGRPTGNQWE
jgi:hypothetical protein